MDVLRPQAEAALPGCSIALKCANDTTITRCLDSIDDDVSVHVVITPNDAIEGILREREVPYSITEYGNIAKSTELSVWACEDDNVIVMDSDTWFLPGSIRKLREALLVDPLAKARLEFQTSGHISEVIASHRHPFNNRPNYATNPGLAMRRTEVRDACRGYIFNPKIRWTEDADLQYRLGQTDLTVAYVPEAVVQHEPITLSHELRAAFLYGVGKRLSIENTPDRVPYEELPDVLKRAVLSMNPANIVRKIREQGVEISALNLAWNAYYLSGYHAQKHTKKWTLPEDK